MSSKSWPAGPTNGRPARILLVARLLAHEHELGVERAFAHDDLCRVRVERAAGAGRSLPSQCVEAVGGGVGGVRHRSVLHGLRVGGRQGRRGLAHRLGPRLCARDQIGNGPSLRHVPPVFLRHLGLHRLHLQSGRVEDAAEVRRPQSLGRVVGHGGAWPSGLQPDFAVLEPGGEVWRDDQPVHVAEAAGEERRVRLDDVVRGLEPGGEGAARSVVLAHFSEAQERAHLVEVAPHRLLHLAQPGEITVGPVGHQARLVPQPPEQRVEPREPFRIGVPRHRLRQRDERLRHGEARSRRQRCLDVEQAWRFVDVAPRDVLGRDALRDERPRRVAPCLRGADAGQIDRAHQIRFSCCGGGAKRARRSALSVSAPGLQPPSVMNGRADFMLAPILATSS